MMMVSTCVEFRLLAMPLIPLSHLGREAEPERKFRLMERVRVAMGERRFSLRTQETYASWIRRYILFHGRRHPSDLDEVDVSAFLSSGCGRVECQLYCLLRRSVRFSAVSGLRNGLSCLSYMVAD